jgi:tetratricopeptide (TPR) repeat protein
MDEINPDVIERYQKIYEQDPRSKVFAPLAEAYRKMGMLKEAHEVATQGVRQHPDFAGGRVALARIYLAQQRYPESVTQLTKAIELSPENVLGYSLLAEAHLHLKQPKEALKAFKKLLFLSPDNEKAQNAVRKLESLTADEYADDIFALKPIKQAVDEWNEIHLDDNTSTSAKTEEMKLKTLERMISLADAYIVRSDHDRAIEALNEAERLFGAHTEIVKRLKIIHQRSLDNIVVPKTSADLAAPIPRETLVIDDQIATLKGLLSALQRKRD